MSISKINMVTHSIVGFFLEKLEVYCVRSWTNTNYHYTLFYGLRFIFIGNFFMHIQNHHYNSSYNLHGQLSIILIVFMAILIRWQLPSQISWGNWVIIRRTFSSCRRWPVRQEPEEEPHGLGWDLVFIIWLLTSLVLLLSVSKQPSGMTPHLFTAAVFNVFTL